MTQPRYGYVPASGGGSGGGGAVSSVAGKTGDVTLTTSDVAGAESTSGAQTKADTARNAAIGFAVAVGV